MTEKGQPRSDEDLVQASIAGNHDSFVVLVRRYQYLVFGLCRNVLGSVDDALDATQDTFIVAYKRLVELRKQNDFRAWLRGIATNECRQRLRSKRPTSELTEFATWIDPYHHADSALDLNRALRDLSSGTRLVLLLYYFEGNSVREIALFLGIPESTVIRRLRNARSQLRRDLQYMVHPTAHKSSLPVDFAERIPLPYDQYSPYEEGQTLLPLSAWRQQWLLSAYPAGCTIVETQMLGHDWEAMPDRDSQVSIRTATGSIEKVVLKMCGRKDGIKLEAELLPVISTLGLNVPGVVLGPAVDPAFPKKGLLVATTPMAGRSACAWAVDGGAKAIDKAWEVVLDAIDLIASVTASVEISRASKLLERCSLADELARVVTIGGPWMTDLQFTDAVNRLEPIVSNIQVPLIFSDSGIGPNTLVDEDGDLIGFSSFEWARIEDPHYQVTKYWTYDCWPLRRAGFVERYLVRKGLTMRDFGPRLAVRALVTLQREIPLLGGDVASRQDMLGWLKLAVDNL